MRRFTVAVALAALGLGGCFGSAPQASCAPSPNFIGEHVAAINRDRASYGKSPLVYDASIAGAAQVHAQAMANARGVYHRDPNSENVIGWYGACRVDGQWLETMWIHSPKGHGTTVLQDRWTRVGVGYVWTADGWLYAVAAFG